MYNKMFLNKKKIVDYWKILFTGSVIFSILWFFIFFAFAYFTRNAKTSLFYSIIIAIVLNTVYFFVAVKYSKTLEAEVDSKDKLYDFMMNYSVIKSWRMTSNASKRAIFIFIAFVSILSTIILISAFLFNW